MKNPTTLIIFGATGDLVAKKIIPSLFNLYKENFFKEKFQIVAFARRDYSNGKFSEIIENSLKTYSNKNYIENKDKLTDFYNLFTYEVGDFYNIESFKNLKSLLNSIDKNSGIVTEKIFYLAVPPEYYKDLFKNISDSELLGKKSGHGSKILVEKPFGENLASAERLEETLSELFDEEQIYRIDHYLAKWVVDNISSFRESNIIFEPSWNSNYIEKINIVILEKLGVENRGKFYDSVGALRDVGQNHLLEILALLTMELPKIKTTENYRISRAKLLSKLKKFTPEEIIKNTKRGQYKGYREINNVDNNSSTETYFKVKCTIDDDRWRDVEITLESGKRFRESEKYFEIIFKPTNGNERNSIKFTIEPEESITIKFNTRKSIQKEITTRILKDEFEINESNQYIAEYTQLLIDAFNGEQKNFVSSDEVKNMWKFIDPIIDSWNKNSVPLEIYE